MAESKNTKQSHGSGSFGPSMGRPVQKAKHFWPTSKRLFAYMKRQWLAVTFVILFAIGSAIFQTQTPKILGRATTEIFKGVMTGGAQIKAGIPISTFPINWQKIAGIILEVIILYVLAALLSFIQQYMMTRVSQKTVFDLRRDLKAKMARLPINYYDTHTNGDVMSRATNDMDNISSTLQQNLTQLITSFVTFFSILWMMLSISLQLTLWVLIIVPVSIVIIGIVAPRSQKFFSAQQKSLGLLNNQIEESYAGYTIVRAYNHEDSERKTFAEENERLYKASWKAQFVSGMIMPLMTFINNLGYIGIAIIGGIKVANGQVTIGNIQAFLQYTNEFSQPITQITNLTNQIQSTIASAERVFQVLDEDEMLDNHQNLPVVKESEIINFDHVQFAYGDNKELLMTDYNLPVKQGEMVAIVGPTGAGKTTMINLLERFYDIRGGSIRFRGRDTRDLDRADLRSHFAMVLQDTWLFSGSIHDNIAYGRENASEADILAAAKAAHVDSFVRQLPKGYETLLNEEASNISQGQRQLITIARAFLANPEILILDEATSSVDSRTEIQIQHAMQNLLKDRTSFVVAHRLSTIRDAQHIVVMNHGSIVETGSHDSLMAKNGFYADLYNSQFSGKAVI
ncbi:ABC transporter ATP-binding protein [Oenococcus kitaharae]|uniref:Lipid A export ATP-binding/permease protein MsbA n=1 Tax=Oenococcus kitaharae DSM 17330 TaxID=1045004 RepID=G9WIV1_9LACO|nr:ABC transporter ATP-binding protein [Oenococcus kitaharae]EHN58400.1 Lipid A export ATP-binding/permease protein MsbA [Oenococcus kitaharae DSM 17330]MCV3296359.1 ABC transporter ATP-binding protein/permease [Oenococcus kitaharae]OEY81437.1 multidrug ABC transporter ATP-binding protein [Oenococcus kitaharae]OEY82925.1 multidrug ABC transporter ATP-binding protein [Oenococcus kitaharae]OEY84531.1 multidrug ABC transporter ATP-binding protein [Oenococcus kitaharae]